MTDVRGPYNRSIVLGLVTLTGFMGPLDFNIIQIALPTIRAELGISVANSLWIVGAYGISLAGFLMLSGRAGDLYGRKKIFIFGLTLFSLASLAGGLAPSDLVLIGARAVQGLGAAIFTANGLAIIAATFPEGRERNRAMAILGTVIGAGVSVAVILGGFLTSTFGWRSVLFVNVPIGLVAAVLSAIYLIETREISPRIQLDLHGAVTVTLALILLVYALAEAANTGTLPAQAIFSLFASLLLFSLFLFIEHRAKSPLVPLWFVRRTTILGSNFLGVIQFAAYQGMMFVLTIYLQQILGYSALVSGEAYLPLGFIYIVASGFSSRLMNLIGEKALLAAGMFLETIAFLILTQISAGGDFFTYVLPATLLFSTGAAFNLVSLQVISLEGANEGEEGLASGLINTSRQTGGPLGIALLLAVAGPLAPGAIASSSTPSLLSGIHYAFVAGAVMTLLGGVIAMLLRGSRKARVITLSKQ